MKYLVLKGCAGLGNRLITLLRAIDYAKATGRTLHIDWSDGMFSPTGTNAFYRYFDLLSTVTSEPDLSVIEAALKAGASTYPTHLSPDALRQNIYRHFDASAPGLAMRFPPYKIGASFIARGTMAAVMGLQTWHPIADKDSSWLHNIKAVRRGRNFPFGSLLSRSIKADIVIFADYRPWVDTSRIFREIKLKDEFESRFRAFASAASLDDAGIGVHVRATDKQPRASYTRLHSRLSAHLDADPAARIFLSTDNPGIEADFRSRHGDDRVIVYPKHMPGTGFEGGLHNWALRKGDQSIKAVMFEESLADMWILSMCHRLYWQGNSSFSLMSARLKKNAAGVKDWLSL